MAWFRLGGAGISAALKNAMTAVLNKKLGTSQEYAPNAWPEEVNLLGALEEKTASGSIVTFADGADDVPLKSCEVALPASLDGYSSIDVVQTGKNLFNMDLLNVSPVSVSDGVASGTGNNFYATFRNGVPNIIVPQTQFTISAKAYTTGTSGNTGNGLLIRIFYTDGTNDTLYFLNSDSSYTTRAIISNASKTASAIGISCSTSGANSWWLKEVQIEVGSTATAYTPYVAPTTYTASLGRTIYGGSADIVNGEGESLCGKIVFDGSETRWAEYATGNGYAIPLTGMKRGTWYTSPLALSSPLPKAPNNDNLGVRIGVNNDGIYVVQANTIQGVTDLASFKAWLSENPLTVIYPLDTSTDFTFEPVEINSRLGNNTMWSDGDMSVVYRASGTVTPIQPTLISKTITANGTYTASDDGADGFDEVIVNVPSAEVEIVPLNSPNAFLTLSGVSGTDVERTVRTETAPSAGKYVFASDSTCRTNTGGGDGFIEIRKNDVSVVKQYMSANTTTDITIPDISVDAGDEITFIVGFDNAHSSCNFQLYTGIAFVSEASVSLLSMSNSNSSNELENELNNTDESEAEQNEELI